MIKRVSSALFIVVLMVAWIILPSTIIPSTYSKVFELNSPDNKYKVIVYHGGIISPMSLYKYLKDEDYFFIIYNASGEVVFKPSPYYGTSNMGAYDGIKFQYGDSHSLFYPGSEGYGSYEFTK
ncbi:DUF6201 family protein [Enterobacter hormaechei]|uniref:DUF6201 family protein n=1 Tax=Enterobacter hormaechei TaxID=158836 RepID=UPI0018891B38|nr:DUF6201 family protein [Enterobacter hormaechei]MBF1962015.1 hypothetical protein [Enterobacter hormaechei]MBF1979461.1 hypothetical protein [Enterobacter hormaechei]